MRRRRFFAPTVLLTLGAPAAAAPQVVREEAFVVEARVPIAGPLSSAFGFDALWVLSSNHLTRIDAGDNSTIRIALPGNLGATYRAIGVGEGAIWVPDITSQVVHKIDPLSKKVVRQVPASMIDAEGSVGLGEGSLWVVTREGRAADRTLTRFDAETGEVEARIALPAGGAGVVVDYGFAWVSSPMAGMVYRVDPRTNAIAATIALLHRQSRFITSAEGSIWVLNEGDGTVQRIDASTDSVIATIATGLTGAYGDVSAGGGYVWANGPFASAVQIDPGSNAVIRKFQGLNRTFDTRYGAGSLWIAEASGVLRIAAPAD